MKILSLKRRIFNPHLKTLALLCAIFFVFSGCARMKEEFNRGLEEGKRNAQKEASEKTDEAKPAPTPTTITAENLRAENGVALNHYEWKYRLGDDPNWALPQTNDADWQTMNPSAANNFAPPGKDWTGIGWFRLHVNLENSLAAEPLGLSVNHPGASEIYVDGKLMQTFGTVSANSEDEKTYNPDWTPVGINFTGGGTHLIAVRYSNTKAKKYAIEPFAFKLRLAPLNSTIVQNLENASLIKGVRGGTFGIGLALGLLHLLLFVLYPRQLGNLFYSLFLLSEVASSLIVESFFPNVGAGAVYVMTMLGTFFGGIYFVSFTAYLYTVLENRLPRYLLAMSALWLLTFSMIAVSYAGIGVLPSVLLFSLAMLIFIAVMLWNLIVVSIVIVRAVIRKVDNSWVLGVVGVAFVISGLSSTVLGIAFGESSKYLYISQFLCLVALIVANAVFLARQFARTSTDLEKQLIKEVEHEKEKSRLLVVEAENERRAKELEEARQLQLSLLPKKLPQIANLEIAAYMKPATEVGGDYYDFYVGGDGTLTAVIGDATGHGLRAGSVVTATKSLFNAFAEEKNIPQIFGNTNRALKAMNLRGLFMAMAMLKIRDNRVTLSVAGMPPMLVYRAASGEIEEIAIRAVPLGSIANFAYQERELQLAPNDVLVLMSDGFPEMFNEAGEMLADNEAKKVLAESAQFSAQEIINRFVKAGENWAGTRPPDDDVTFVVLKVK